MGHRIQQWLKVILAGLDERDAISGADMETLHRELRMLLQIDRLEIAAAEIDKAEQVLGYMLRPSIEECLNLWFGKSEQTDQEIWNRFGADVALGVPGPLRSLGPERRAPAPARGAGDHARPVPAQHVPRHAADVCLRRALPHAGEARAARRREQDACARSSGSSSAWRSPTPRRSTTSICAWRSGAGRWRSWRRTTR